MKIKVKQTRMEHKIDKKVLKNRERKRISNKKTIKTLFNKSQSNRECRNNEYDKF